MGYHIMEAYLIQTVHEKESCFLLPKQEVSDSSDDKSTEEHVFADQKYALKLKGADINPHGIEVYINGDPIVLKDVLKNRPEEKMDEVVVHFSKMCIFQDYFGSVEISLRLDGNDSLTSARLPVYVPKNENTVESVRLMTEYIRSNCAPLLKLDTAKKSNKSALSMEQQIELAKRIAEAYKDGYSYFKNHSRFRIDKKESIVPFERMQGITSSTLQFIASHPEELRRVRGQSGIKIKSHYYQPCKTLSVQNSLSYDTYENRVILGFIVKMVDYINRLLTKHDKLSDKIRPREEYKFEKQYIDSSMCFLEKTKEVLDENLNALKHLKEIFVNLLKVYKKAFKIRPEILHNMPALTGIFRFEPEYNRIYVLMREWYNFDIYDFAAEGLFHSFWEVSRVYEVYLLTKMIRYFNASETAPEGENQQDTSPDKDINKTFVFRKAVNNVSYTCTLYYQPVIYTEEKYKENEKKGIGLVCHNYPIPYRGSPEQKDNPIYYSPDYLIKAEDGSAKIKYLILDAKFSNHDNVRDKSVPDLFWKYLFRIAPVEKDSSVQGLCALYGKCVTDNDVYTEMESLYKYDEQPGMPLIELLPMSEISSDEGIHFEQLDKLMEKFLAKK